MGKVSLLHERVATSTSAFKGNSGEHAFLLPSFLFLRPRRPDVKTELVTVPTSTLSGKASPRSRGPPWRRFFHEGWKVVCQPK